MKAAVALSPVDWPGPPYWPHRVLSYGATQRMAVWRVQALALRCAGGCLVTFYAPETGQRTSQRASPGDKRRFPRHICESPGIERSDLIEPNSVLVCWLANRFAQSLKAGLGTPGATPRVFVLSRSLRSGIESDDGRKTLTPKKWAGVIERIKIQSR